MGSDRPGSAADVERGVADVKGGLGGLAQHPGMGAAGEDVSFDVDDGGDVGTPFGVGEFACGIEHGDGAGFVAVAAAVAAVNGPGRRTGCGDLCDLLVQARLVVLHLDDRRDAASLATAKCFSGSAAHRA
ncbi:MAG: hypothetical protein M0Z28_27625 [Rhodospirillales bacterium]|nr:hypothetical protein [Rhodospirillales bacterium]